MTPSPRLSSSRIAIFAAMLAAAAGCLGEPGAPEDEIESQTGAVQGGQLETGLPTVGLIQNNTGGTCTGTLIAPSYVLTAKHCQAPAMTFKLGTDASNFVSHATDQQIVHPMSDLMILHLTSPIEGKSIMRYNTSDSFPAVGTNCTMVGFGGHAEPDGSSTSGKKRSATVQITSTDNTWVIVKWGTGISAPGDSGGPLICNGLIEGVLYGSNQVWPNTTHSFYTPAEAAWIDRVIQPTYTDLALTNGWQHAPYSTRNAGATLVNDSIVQLKGAISGGASGVAFTLSAPFIPANDVYVPLDLCNATNGRLYISAATGTATVQATGAFSDASCFTSLEGVFYPRWVDGFTNLTLINGWTNQGAGTGTAGVMNVDNVVRFKGAIKTTGTNSVPFVLPVELRPSTNVYVNVGMRLGAKGRLYIETNGNVTVYPLGPWSDAQSMVSLDGVSFVRTTMGTSPLTLQNGWTAGPFTTSAPAAVATSGVVHLKGAIANSNSSASMAALSLPAALRPSTVVYVPVDLCGGAKGRLMIDPSGTVTIGTTGGGSATCFTSLDGASYTLTEYAPLKLENGWSNATYAPSAMGRAGFALAGNFVRFKGAITTTGTNGNAFQMPRALRPTSEVYVPVSVCGGKKGRLRISPNGNVNILGDGGVFSTAACLTSLDGASYAVSAATMFQLTLQNGWYNAPFSTRNAASTYVNEVIHLAGAIATTGTNPVAFTLPSAHRPPVTVYLPIDLCSGAKGRLVITSSGNATVVADNGVWSDAQCFTSLEGVTFPASTAAFSTLSLSNGWTPWTTRAPSYLNTAGVVRLAGALSGGTNATMFTLPAGARPAKDIYIAADLCSGAKGRFRIQPSGAVTVENGEGTFAGTAGCFTSLEGVWFALGTSP